MTTTPLRVRRSLQEVQNDYTTGGGMTHFEVEVRTRDGLLGQPRALAMAAGAALTAVRKPFRFEVR